MSDCEMPERIRPWWTRKQNMLASLVSNDACEGIMYGRKADGEWEYAYVEWREGTAYLFGLFRQGCDVTPVGGVVVTKREFRENAWK